MLGGMTPRSGFQKFLFALIAGCIVVAVLVIILIVVGFILEKKGIIKNPLEGQSGIKMETNSKEISNSETISSVSIDIVPEEEYKDMFEYHSNEIASDSDRMQSEKEVCASLKELGFDIGAVKYEFAEDGSLNEGYAKDSSDAKHPNYSFNYSAKNGNEWLVSSIGGEITAISMSYSDGSGKTLVVLTKDQTLSYDAVTHKYYEITLSPDVFKVRIVDTVDAKTLDKIKAD